VLYVGVGSGEDAIEAARRGIQVTCLDLSTSMYAAHRIYYRVANIAYWTLGLCALHSIYNYADYYSRLGLTLKKTDRFRVFGRGPWFFQTTTAVKDRWLDAQVFERSPTAAESEQPYFAAASAAS
jgi:hypothetical protein